MLETFATATHEAEKDEDLYPFKKPSLLAKIKFDLLSEKPDSVLIISFFSNAESSTSFKYSIFSSFSIWSSSYKFRSLISLANKSLSGKELNSSSGVIFVVSMHLSIKVLILFSVKFDEEILDFFFLYRLLM